MKISDTTKKRLEEETLANTNSYVNLIDSVRSSVLMLDRVEDYMSNANLSIPDSNYHLRRIGEYTMLLGLIWLDITTAFRVYLNAKENYETIYSTKQLLIIINEGFKKIYGYISIDQNGNYKTKERNKSFWVNDIGKLVKSELTHLTSKYDEITVLLDSYDDEELKNMKTPRDLFVHYDNDPTKVYDELIKLDIEKMTIKIIPFMGILSKMVFFSQNVLKAYAQQIEDKKNDFFNFHHQKLEQLKMEQSGNQLAIDLLNQVQADLIKFKGL